MKKNLLILITVLSACSGYAQEIPTGKDFSKLEWLLGTWTRQNMKPGRNAHERWEKSGDELKGYGVSLSGTDTTFVEKLTIVVKDNAIYYVADVTENAKPVYFKITSLTENGFSCENPEHDFPKKIEYVRSGSSLKATISGNGKSMDFHFTK